MMLKDDILKIDLAHLEDTAAEQARLLRKWADKLATANKEAKLAKRKVRLVRAELSRVIRSSPAKYRIIKVTEDSVEDVVVMSHDFKAAEAELIEAEYNRDVLQAMVSSLHERGEQIGNEVKLFGQQYWAKPKLSGEIGVEAAEVERRRAMRAATEALE